MSPDHNALHRPALPNHSQLFHIELNKFLKMTMLQTKWTVLSGLTNKINFSCTAGKNLATFDYKKYIKRARKENC